MPSKPPTVSIGADHAGYDLKRTVVEHLTREGVRVIDLGTDSTVSVDYPDFARKVAHTVLSREADWGILVCGTGIGMSMAANRYPGIRAAVCHDHFTAVTARRHNDANILCLGGRLLGDALALEIVETFRATAFEGGRHRRRIEAIDEEKADL